MVKKIQKKKRQASEKQREALAKARLVRMQNLMKQKDESEQPEPEIIKQNDVQPVIAIEEKTVEQVEQKEEKQTMPKLEKTKGRAWWQVGIGITLMVAAYFLAMSYSKDMDNVVYAFGFLVTAIGGGFFCYLGLKRKDEGVQVNRAGMPKGKKTPANCLNIYYGYDKDEEKYYCDYIAFEWMESDQITSRHPQQCLDDNKWYYVHFYDPVKNIYKPFVLQDTIYFSPGMLPNPLQMPASRKVLKPKATLGEKLRPVIALGAMGLIIFAFVITAPPPAP